MKIYGHPGCNGIGYYSRELAKVLDAEWIDLLPIFYSGGFIDGVMVCSVLGPFNCIQGASGCVPFWEFVHLPSGVPMSIQHVFAPSRFIHSIVGGIVLPIIAVKQEQSVPNKDFTVLYCFDSDSNLFRKNPVALIEACRKMRIKPKLIIKTNIPRPPDVKDEWIEWINGHLSQDEYESLWKRSTIYVSPHRSEGIGMTIVEAMGRGLPVVVTGYGGCVEFLNPEYSELIPYSWVPMEKNTHLSYSALAGFPIPDPSIDAMAFTISKLMDDYNLVLRMGEAAIVKHRQMVHEWTINTSGIFNLAGF